MSTNVVINNNKIGLTRNDGINYLELNRSLVPNAINLQLIPPTYNQIDISNNTIDHALQYGIKSYNNYSTEILFENNSIEQAAQGGIVYFNYPNNENINLNGNNFGENVSPEILPYHMALE
jgi:hypothetical protein